MANTARERPGAGAIASGTVRKVGAVHSPRVHPTGTIRPRRQLPATRARTHAGLLWQTIPKVGDACVGALRRTPTAVLRPIRWEVWPRAARTVDLPRIEPARRSLHGAGIRTIDVRDIGCGANASGAAAPVAAAPVAAAHVRRTRDLGPRNLRPCAAHVRGAAVRHAPTGTASGAHRSSAAPAHAGSTAPHAAAAASTATHAHGADIGRLGNPRAERQQAQATGRLTIRHDPPLDLAPQSLTGG